MVGIDARIIVATHKNLAVETQKGNFREDLYYRLLGLPILLPPLRERSTDILLLAKYFLDNFCVENNFSSKNIGHDTREKLLAYRYPGNVRELKAIMELAAVMVDGNTINQEDITFNSIQQTLSLLDQDLTLEEYELQIIRHYLNRYQNNVLEVAKKLNVGKSTIYRLLKENKL